MVQGLQVDRQVAVNAYGTERDGMEQEFLTHPLANQSAEEETELKLLAGSVREVESVLYRWYNKYLVSYLDRA
ncbi:hypothetical protein MGYG_03696 [Nannizzia gypsea CBS 118893]|uniref:Uncharacterized protein n=1 Tax=Arthroderma gypseum (strain ATCC MYA-4604 / CBS 118893) TaxID=535722 RepID=E4UTD0_ARTGP|nr:hypothetical protein MGYG_03696 [Nannizzia gypsea CBS 118893]EFR00691.1 hypothetical protein MGYG_03696 [Nannizzia gypsea CBS 118893]